MESKSKQRQLQLISRTKWRSIAGSIIALSRQPDLLSPAYHPKAPI